MQYHRCSPVSIVTDGLNAYHMPLRTTHPESKHSIYDSFCDDSSNNMIESFHRTFKVWYKTKKDFIILNLLWISFLILCFSILLSIAILICSDKRLLLLHVLYTSNNKQNTGFYLYALFYDCIFKSLFCTSIVILS